jgi:23S rRNA (guanine2445-N2)-methyltransferase / 23S rRNA (guanine2069-N7)-methyltransferase
MQWLKDCKDTFDLIVMDPPTFSNSARMNDTLDVQRDHVFLVTEAMKCLSAHGELIFSNNYKKFFMDESLYDMFHIKDISNQSIPQDYKRKKPHRCFEIKHKLAN